MNVFYAAHRTGDQDAAAAALRSFDESAARLPANDPLVTEMGELKEALGSVPARRNGHAWTCADAETTSATSLGWAS